jgi:hypothetical protein
MKTLGICFGATTVQHVKLSVPNGASGASGAVIEATRRVAHEGDPRGAALKLLADPALRGVDRVAVTGRALSCLPSPSRRRWSGRYARTIRGGAVVGACSGKNRVFEAI